MEQALEWDSPSWRAVRNEKLKQWLGDEGAECVVLLSTVAETWDDLLDKDKPLSSDDISNAFIISLIDLEVNRFWQTYRNLLFPIMVTGINAWLDSNELVQMNIPRTRMLAFYLRNYCAEIVQMAAFCVGGFTHMRKVSMEVREFLNHETYYEWEHRHV